MSKVWWRQVVGTTPATILMWDSGAATRRPPPQVMCTSKGQALPSGGGAAASVPASHSLVSRFASPGVEGNGGQLGLWKSTLFSRKLISPAVAFCAIGE